MADEDDMTYDELRARMANGIPVEVMPGPRPVMVDWEAEAAVWGEDTRRWAEEVTHDSDPDSDS